MREQHFELGGTRIFSVSQGSGTPVICLHGITANAYVFEPIIRLLADRFEVLSIDQRGHGRSGRPQGYAAGDYAGDVADLVEKLGGGPAILLGHSLGARNAIVAAARHPERVRGIVAVDFTPYIEREVFDQLEARVNGGDRAFPELGEVQAYLANRYPLIPPEAIARRARHGYHMVQDGYRPLAGAGAMSATVAGLRAPLEGELAGLKKPAILVRGAISKLVSKEAWRKTRALRPDLEAVEIDGADHYVPEEKPAQIAALVARIHTSIKDMK